MQRLQTLIRLVPPSKRVIDVGADHGLVSLGLAEREDIQQVLATDISSASLSKLEEALKRTDPPIREKITLFVTDGLQDIPWSSADAIVIAGMGGPLITRILRDSFAFARNAKTWVLSPQSGIAAFRHFLQTLSCRIEEDLVEEDGKWYPLFLVFPQEVCPKLNGYVFPLTEQEAEYGPELLRKRHPLLEKQLIRDEKHWKSLLFHLEGKSSPAAAKRREEAERALRALQALRKRYDDNE